MKRFNAIASLMLFAGIILSGCNNGIDYVIHGEGEGETVYVDVPGETITEYIEVEVPGDTEYGEIWVDSFVQPQSVDGVDILWVIDTSGSMGQYRDELLAGIEAMMGALPSSGWRLAMTSNDPSKASVESQFPLVPGDDAEDARDMFDAMGNGHREEGLDATYEYLVNNTYAQTWLRPDAALLVVQVSDEEDQSDDHFSDVDDFKSWYGSQRGGSVFFSSIVTHDSSVSVCDWTTSPVNVGDRYMDVTNFFSGVIVDICSDDWSPGVTDASNRIDPYEELELTYVTSHEDTMRVFWNGVLNWDWYYDPSDNTVYFTITPDANVLVEVAYHYDPDDPYGTGADTGDTGDTGL